MVGRRDAWGVTPEDTYEAGAGGCHAVKQRGRERVTIRQETHLASHLEWVAERGAESPPEWRKTSEGIDREWEGGSSIPRVINTPGVEEIPWGDKTSGVTSEGDVVPGEDGRGQEGDGNSPTTRDTEASGDSGSGEEITSGMGKAAPLSPQLDSAAGRGSETRTHRHPTGANGARSEHGALARRKYGLLTP